MPPKKQHDTKPAQPKQENKLPLRDAEHSVAPPEAITNAERQQEEVISLKSIYLEDFEEVKGKPAAWHKPADLAFNIHLKAVSDPTIAVTLGVQLPATYPKSVPRLTIKNFQSGNPEVPTRLQGILTSKPKDLEGEPMIYDICLLLRDVLDEAADQKTNNEGLQSLEEERAARQAEIDQQALERQQHILRQKESETTRKAQILADQVQQEHNYQERLRLAQRPAKTQHPPPASEIIDKQITIFEQPMTTKCVRGTHDITFSAVWGRFVVMRVAYKEITIVSPVIKDEDKLVPQLLLKNIMLLESKAETDKFQQAMGIIQEHLNKSKIHRHPNVVDLLGYQLKRALTSSTNNDWVAQWHLSILSEYANKGSLLELLEMSGGLDAKKVRSWTHQILDALEFFDKNQYIHPAVHAGNVLLFRSRTGNVSVKLSDGYGTALKTLVMLDRQARKVDENTVLETPFWRAPELAQENALRTQKTCIWDLGVVMLQMALGPEVTRQYTSPKQCIDGTDMSEPFEEMLVKMFQFDPTKRPRAFDLASLPFIQRDRGPLLFSGSPLAPSTPYRRTRRDSFVASTTPAFVTSRFETEFENFGRLGKGGFGEVLKARNRMDQQFYAVKKITCNSNEALTAMLSETKLLSRLNDPYVVRYYGAWDEKEQSSSQGDRSTSDMFDQEVLAPSFNDPFNVTHDQMSSSNYRNIGIQFGDSNVDEDNLQGQDQIHEETSLGLSSSEGNNVPEATDEQALPIDRRASRHPQARPEKTTLYIQMEYCENRTLWNLIQQDLNLDEGWRLLYQILMGLKHIHASGIIHRDLKPANIFIDGNNNVRIGDFGLATTGLFSAAAKGSDTLTAGPETRSIGTMYYVAPELSTKGSGKYSSKVDMYSLGIIVFEMCYPLKTNMERDKEMRIIRHEYHELPPRFKSPELAVQGQVIMLLLNHDQHKRPSAAELLESGLVSEPLEQAKIERYLKTMSDSNPSGYAKMMSAQFSQPVKKARDLAWNHKSSHPVGLADSLVTMSVKETITAVFRRHGAVENSRQTILPRSDHYTGTNAATFLDRSGMVVQLPYDLTMPSARSLANTKLEYEKTYSIGTVFRKSTEGTEPIAADEVNFDIISYDTVDLALKEAEAIRVLDEIIMSFPVLRSMPITIHINHCDLLDLILEYARIKPEQQTVVKSVLSSLNVGQSTWSDTKRQLRSGPINVSATSVDILERFDFRGDFETVTKRLGKVFHGSSYIDRAAQIFARIGIVVEFTQRFEVKMRIIIDPLSNNSERLYHGSLVFRCMNERQKQMIAVGGRYDALIKEYQSRISSTLARAVGFRVSPGAIAQTARGGSRRSRTAKSLKHSPYDSTRPDLPRCDVLVTSPDANILRTTGIDLVTELWDNEISAELTGDLASMEELEMAYENDAYAWVITIRYDSSAVGERSFKVRSMLKKEDTDMQLTDMIPWLRSEMRDRDHQAGTSQQITPKLRRETSTNEPSASASESREVDIRVLTPQHRAKKTNRRQLVDAAVAKTHELVQGFLRDAPIVAIETRDETIEYMRNIRLNDDHLWRAVIQEAPLQERKYLQEVRKLLQDITAEHKRGVFIFNHRTKTCIYYDLPPLD